MFWVQSFLDPGRWRIKWLLPDRVEYATRLNHFTLIHMKTDSTQWFCASTTWKFLLMLTSAV